MSTAPQSVTFSPTLLRNFFERRQHSRLSFQSSEQPGHIDLLHQANHKVLVEVFGGPGPKSTNFSIRAALERSGFAEKANFASDRITIPVRKVSELYDALKLGFNHLQWYDDSRVSCTIG